MDGTIWRGGGVWPGLTKRLILHVEGVKHLKASLPHLACTAHRVSVFLYGGLGAVTAETDIWGDKGEGIARS